MQNSGSYETSPDPTPQAAVGVYRLLGGNGTKAEIRRAFYERPAGKYAIYQRSLCNKCHTKD